jgi:hypothetical protein
MRMFSEPESWVGLRSERLIAGEFDAPVARDTAVRRPKAEEAGLLSLREVRGVMRRTLTMLLGR